MTVSVDASAPVVTITSPTDAAHYQRGAAVTADFACTDAGSGIATCDGTIADGAPLPPDTVGTHTVTVTATDAARNATTRTVTYEVTEPDALSRLDKLSDTIRGYKLPRRRSTTLLTLVETARQAVVAGRKPAACASVAAFAVTEELYAALRWLTKTQASELRTQTKEAWRAIDC